MRIDASEIVVAVWTLIFVGCFIAGICLVIIFGGGGILETAEQRCKNHQGVASVESREAIWVCRDGTAGTGE